MTPEADRSVFESRESAVRGYCRRFPTVFVRAKGSLLHGADGRSYIDFLAGCGALNYGHNDPDLSRALIEHIERDGLSMALDLHTDAKQRFLAAFAQHVLEPRGMGRHRVQFTGPTGTNAVEAALKLARKVTGRHEIVAFTNGYHGVSLGALAATGNRYNRMGAPLAGVTRMPYDGYLGPGVDTARILDKMLSDPSSGVDLPAAVLLEVVQGEGGLTAASPNWVRAVAELARRHGALLIVDDIQAGCGRTGSFFSFEGMGVEPDLVTLSKSISGFGLPMSLVLIREDHDRWRPAEHNGTFRGNTHAFVTAAAMVEKFWATPDFQARVEDLSRDLTQAVQRMAALVPGSRPKGRGMMQGLDVGDARLADRISRRCFERGVVLELAGPHDEVLKFLAPLTTPPGLLRQGLEIVHQVLAEALRERDPAPAATRADEPLRERLGSLAA